MNAKSSILFAGAFLQRHKLPVVFCAALAFGGFAAWGINSHIGVFLATEKERLAPKVKTIEVVVAKRNLKVGDVVGLDSMSVRNIPEAFVPSHAVLPDRFEGFIGSKLGQQMHGGEALLTTAMMGADVSSFSSKVRPGIRALTIQVDEVNSVSGMLQPGDRIDLMVSIKPPSQQAPGLAAGPQPEVTAPLLQDILVLATGRNIRPGSPEEQSQRSFNAITVEVTPENAQVLIVAQRGGKLTALLRNPGDRNDLPKRNLDVNALLGFRPVAPQHVQAPVTPRIASLSQFQQGPEIIVGGRGALNRQSAAIPQGLAPKGPSRPDDPTLSDGPVASPQSGVPPSIPVSPLPAGPSGATGSTPMLKAPLSGHSSGQSGSWPAHGLPQSIVEVR